MTAFDRVKKLCEEKHLSVVELEEKLGFSRNSLYSWKKNKPSSDKLEKVADYFNVTTDYLLGRTAFKRPTSLYEPWGPENIPDFEAPFDIGKELKELRLSQGSTLEEVSRRLDITTRDLIDIEEGIIPINRYLAEIYANHVGLSVDEILVVFEEEEALKNIPTDLLNHYEDQGMSYPEIREAYTKYVKAKEIDALSEDAEGIAAHKEGEDWTEEELEEIERFKEFVRSKRKS